MTDVHPYSGAMGPAVEEAVFNAKRQGYHAIPIWVDDHIFWVVSTDNFLMTMTQILPTEDFKKKFS